MPKRKTLTVEALRDEVNRRNRESTCQPDVRRGWNALLETFLHGTGNYQGFGYLQQNRVPDGELPGIVFDESDARKHEYPDETRRCYFGG